jgi:mannan endo-1,4-beta-mannosidase
MVKKIPIIFRPWHEHTGWWFWWAKGHCSEANYVSLWKFTVNYLSDKKRVDNLLYAYSPSSSPWSRINSRNKYLYGYPGDTYIDILGLDNYYDLRHYATSIRKFVKSLEIVVSIANEKNKPAALAETGAFTLFGKATMPEKNWFTKKLLKGIMHNEITRQISYAMVWHNANTSHFHAPYSGHPGVPDFLDFYNHPYTIFMSEMKDQ